MYICTGLNGGLLASTVTLIVVSKNTQYKQMALDELFVYHLPTKRKSQNSKRSKPNRQKHFILCVSKLLIAYRTEACIIPKAFCTVSKLDSSWGKFQHVGLFVPFIWCASYHNPISRQRWAVYLKYPLLQYSNSVKSNVFLHRRTPVVKIIPALAIPGTFHQVGFNELFKRTTASHHGRDSIVMRYMATKCVRV